jgi:hypothetical protein
MVRGAFFVAATVVFEVASHAAMVSPVPKQPDSLYWFQVGCYLGCLCAGRGKEAYPSPQDNDCPFPREPSNNEPDKRTFNVHNLSPKGDWSKYFPWRGPGFAVPLDSCGIASGFKKNEVNYGSRVSDGFQQGDKFIAANGGAKSVSASVNAASNHWMSGGTAEVSFTMVVNHGGGYQYRLCPKDAPDMDEACFEAGALDFATSSSEIRFADSNRKSVTIQAVDVGANGDSTVVNPPNKAWRRIPVPACACDSGGPCIAKDLYGKTGYSVFYDVSASGEGSDAARFHAVFHEKMSMDAQKLIDCGAKDEGAGVGAQLQYYPEFLLEGDWLDGYGYYMSGRTSAKQKKDEGSMKKKEDPCRVFDGKQAECEAETSSSCAIVSYEGTDYCVAAEESAEKDPCRAFDGKPTDCEAETSASCVVYSYEDKEYCIQEGSKAKTTSKGKEDTTGSSAKEEKTGSAEKENGDKSDAQAGSTESYFAREYDPSPDDFEVVDTLQVPTVNFAAGEDAKEYVLSWRWDCEQTPQIWTTCADITIHRTQCSLDKSLGITNSENCDEASTAGELPRFVVLLASVLFLRGS